MMIVQKFCQLLAQAFVALAFMTQRYRPLEQRVLHLVRQFAPEIGGRRAEDKKIARGVFVGRGLLRWRGHEQSSGWFGKSVADRIGPGNLAGFASPQQITSALV
jgi:hypothetical protein